MLSLWREILLNLDFINDRRCMTLNHTLYIYSRYRKLSVDEGKELESEHKNLRKDLLLLLDSTVVCLNLYQPLAAYIWNLNILIVYLILQ